MILFDFMYITICKNIRLIDDPKFTVMKTLQFLMLFVLLSGTIYAQTQPREKALLYRISGNGLQKPSFLYGTMHVSNKLAFHLSDTFFNAIKSVEIVGLETDPSKWFEQMLISKYYQPSNLFDGYEEKMGTINKNALRLSCTNNQISRSFYNTPGIINGFLYRHRESRGDFEEDTYLDLYIYQTARRLGKEVHSVEDFEESERLVTKAREALQNARRNYIRHKGALTGDMTMETAYRTGDLIMMDSLDRLQGYPEGWYDFMLYQRNKNMANYMDSIMRTQNMFVGVGASHLPGSKGMIQLLREKGYTVTPIPVFNQNSRQREVIDKINVKQLYSTFTAEDSLFSITVPGKVYAYPKEAFYQKYLCQDMANGSYYLITRVRTYAALHKQSTDYTLARVDSLLFENIPGKIEEKKSISIGPYKGFDIVNRTARGNYQRHYIVILPNEIILFRMHGTEDYVLRQGQPFFNSIKILSHPEKPFLVKAMNTGFDVTLPNRPMMGIEQSPVVTIVPARKEWLSTDADMNTYYVVQYILNNSLNLDEDSFELDLMANYLAKELAAKVVNPDFIPSLYSSKFTCSLVTDQKDTCHLQLYMNGGKVYLLLSRSNNKQSKEQFFQSFSEQPSSTAEKIGKPWKDTTLLFSVNAWDIPRNRYRMAYRPAPKDTFDEVSEALYFADKQSGNEVQLNYYHYNKYEHETDSAEYWKWRINRLARYKDYKHHVLERGNKQGCQYMDVVFSDTGSTRGIRYKLFVANGNSYTLSTPADSTGKITPFAQSVFNTFQPFPEHPDKSIFKDRTWLFKRDLLSEDSTTRAQALASMSDVNFDPDSFNSIIHLIEHLPVLPKYESVKASLIRELDGDHKDVRKWLEQTYNNSGDSIDLQLAVLNVLCSTRDKESYKLWNKLITDYVPDVTEEQEVKKILGGFTLLDSNTLIKLVLPNLLQLLANQEYKNTIYEQLASLSKHNQLKPSWYKNVVPIMLTDARRALKQYRDRDKRGYYYGSNNSLQNINRLLIPYYNNARVAQHFSKVLTLNNDEVKINTIALLVKNGHPVDDTIIYNLAAKRNTRQQIFVALNEAKRTDLFPAKFAEDSFRVEGICAAVVKRFSQATDTLVVLGHQTSLYKNNLYDVYWYKFRKNDDLVWQTGICATLQTDRHKKEFDFLLSGVSKQYYTPDLETATFISNEIREQRAGNRNSRYTDEGYYYNDYEYAYEED